MRPATNATATATTAMAAAILAATIATAGCAKNDADRERLEPRVYQHAREAPHLLKPPPADRAQNR